MSDEEHVELPDETPEEEGMSPEPAGGDDGDETPPEGDSLSEY